MNPERKRNHSNTRKIVFNMAFKNSKDKRARYTDAVADAAVARLFGKCFELSKNHNSDLPKPEKWFSGTPWKIEALQEMKNALNKVKGKLNDYNLAEWSRHTRQRNKAGNVQWKLRKEIEPEFLTQAWCKFYENSCSFPLIPEKTLSEKKLNSVHLCEAPGAFVTALNHWLKLNAPEVHWNWLATTLNPHYEGNSLSRMVNDDRFIIHTSDNWFFGLDNTGNLMDLKNLDAMIAKAGTETMLVTADGSIDCLDSPGEQEQVVSHLHYCQVVAALQMLQKGGSFLLKLFTIFEHHTICLIYLLSCCFHKLYVNKPVTSKEGNSEVYIVCLGFAGPDFITPYIEILRKNYETPSDMAIFQKSDIPVSFIQQIVNCGEFFKAHQSEVILNNMRTFGRESSDEYRTMKNIKRMVAERFIKQYNLRALSSEKLEIVGKIKLAENDCTMVDFRAPLESFNSRRKRENLKAHERLAGIIENFEFIQLPDAFKLNDITDKLSISTGKPYTRVHSSKFSTAVVLKMYNTALDIVDDVGFTGVIPSSASVEQFSKENVGVKIINFGFTSRTDSHKFIIQVMDAITNLEENQSITFVGYSLLSRLNVGILYVLCKSFQSVQISPCEKLGCVINLTNYIKLETKTGCKLREIYDASIEAKRKDEAVLSVLPLSTLCDSASYSHIVSINHWVVKHCVHNLYNNLTECNSAIALST